MAMQYECVHTHVHVHVEMKLYGSVTVKRNWSRENFLLLLNKYFFCL
jgi:hypothetical protein